MRLNISLIRPDFLEAGTSGPLVVLVHSGVSGARQWRRLMDASVNLQPTQIGATGVVAPDG